MLEVSSERSSLTVPALEIAPPLSALLSVIQSSVSATELGPSTAIAPPLPVPALPFRSFSPRIPIEPAAVVILKSLKLGVPLAKVRWTVRRRAPGPKGRCPRARDEAWARWKKLLAGI